MESQDAISTRELVLQAALKNFAHRGYEGTSVQDIVNDAQVTKPTLYYYFRNKAELYQALIDQAHDKRLQIMQQAAERGCCLREKLVEIITELFEFLKNNRELMRLTFATSFAAQGELPSHIQYFQKGFRNFEFVHGLIRQGVEEGVITRKFSTHLLTMQLYGVITMHAMGHIYRTADPLDREVATHIVELFFQGAAAVARGC